MRDEKPGHAESWTAGPIPLLLVLSIFGLYVRELCPTVFWRDSAEFQLVGYALGIPHPAGSPAYIPLAKLFSLLPFGEVAFRINLLSAVSGALAAGMLSLLCFELIKLVRPAGLQVWGARLASLVGALIFGLCPSFWLFSEVAEVYSLQALCLLTLLWLGARCASALQAGPRQPGTRNEAALRLAVLFSLLYGLSLGVHISLVFFAPVFLACLWRRRRELGLGRREAGRLLFLFLLGASVYLYLPLRSAAHPLFQWGELHAPGSLLDYLLGRRPEAAAVLSGGGRTGIFDLLFQYLRHLKTEIGVHGVALGLAGLCVLIWKRRGAGLALAAIILINASIFIAYGWRRAFCYIPSFALLSVAAGMGWAWVIACMGRTGSIFRSQRFQVAASAALAAVVAWSGLTTGSPHTGRAYAARDFTEEAIRECPGGALLLDYVHWFVLFYLQAVEEQRLDLINYNRPALYAAQRSAQSSPASDKAAGGPLVRFVDEALDRGPVCWEPDLFDEELRARALPRGLLYELAEGPRRPSEEEYKTSLRAASTLVDDLRGDGLKTLGYDGRLILHATFLSMALYCESRWALDRSRPSLRYALGYLDLAEAIRPDTYAVSAERGKCFARLGEPILAEEAMRRAVDLEPGRILGRMALGRLYLEQGDPTRALEELGVVLERAPNLIDAIFDTGVCHEQLGRTDEAVRAWERVIAIHPDHPIAERARGRIRKALEQAHKQDDPPTVNNE